MRACRRHSGNSCKFIQPAAAAQLPTSHYTADIGRAGWPALVQTRAINVPVGFYCSRNVRVFFYLTMSEIQPQCPLSNFLKGQCRLSQITPSTPLLIAPLTSNCHSPQTTSCLFGYSIKVGAGLVGWAPGPGPGPGLGYVSLYRQAACSHSKELHDHSHVPKSSMNLYCGARTVGIAIDDGLGLSMSVLLGTAVVPSCCRCLHCGSGCELPVLRAASRVHGQFS